MLNYSEKHRFLSLEFANRFELSIALETIVAIIVIIIALSGNVLVCTAVYKNRNLRTRQNVYIVNLAISDIVMAMFVVTLSLGALMTGRWPYNNTLCQMQGFVALMVNMVSLETMTLIAVHRFFKVVHPRLYNKIFKKSSVVVSVVIAWIFALAFQINYRYIMRLEYIFHPGKIVCCYLSKRERFSGNIIISAFIIQIPLFIIAFCYYKVHRKVSDHKTMSFTNNPTVNKARSVSEIKVNRLLFAVVLSFVFCWVIPVNAVDLSASFLGQFSLPKIVYLVYSFLIALASCINPIIYNVLSREFRVEFKRIVACGHIRRSRRVRQMSQVKASVIAQVHLDCTGKPGLDIKLCTVE